MTWVPTVWAVSDRRRFFLGKGDRLDLNILTLEKAVENAAYCRNNLIPRRLVCVPSDWRWSCFRWLELRLREKEPLALEVWDEALSVGNEKNATV